MEVYYLFVFVPLQNLNKGINLIDSRLNEIQTDPLVIVEIIIGRPSLLQSSLNRSQRLDFLPYLVESAPLQRVILQVAAVQEDLFESMRSMPPFLKDFALFRAVALRFQAEYFEKKEDSGGQE